MPQRWSPINYNLGYWFLIGILAVMAFGVLTVVLGPIVALCLLADDERGRREWDWVEWLITSVLCGFALWMLVGLAVWPFSHHATVLVQAITVYLGTTGVIMTCFCAWGGFLLVRDCTLDFGHAPG